MRGMWSIWQKVQTRQVINSRNENSQEVGREGQLFLEVECQRLIADEMINYCFINSNHRLTGPDPG